MASDVNEKAAKVTVAARVPVDLALEVARMAENGNRTTSREVWAAIAEHVALRKDPPPQVPSGQPRGSSSPSADHRAAARGGGA
jgi:hypothetical protein